MLMGIQLRANPTSHQKVVLSQWMGCARFMRNAKCSEDKDLSTFARKYMPLGTYASIDQKYSQYKNDALSPWLGDCPSQILRNSARYWYQTYQRFLKGECGKPKGKKKSSGGSIHLTRELFEFRTCDDGIMRLFIASKTNNIDFLAVKFHGLFNLPKSIYMTKKNGIYWVSFCYGDRLDDSQFKTDRDHLKFFQGAAVEFLVAHTIGIDRGVVRPIQSRDRVYDLTPEQKKRKKIADTGRGAKPKTREARASSPSVVEASKKKRKAAKAA